MLRWTVCARGGPRGSKGNASVAVGHEVYCLGGPPLRESDAHGPPLRESDAHGDEDHLDVHIFNTVSLRWAKLAPPAPTTDRGQRSLAAAAAEAPPSRRHRHTAALIDHVVYVWGGYSYAARDYCNVLYALDVLTRHWSRPAVSGSAPGPRYNHSACVLGKVMFVYGGFDRLARYTDDIYKLDTAAMVWSAVVVAGGSPPPPVLDLQSATVIGTRMLVFGGYSHSHDYSVVGAFDAERDRWPAAHSIQLLPEGRWGHSAFAHKGELYVIGGHNLCQSFDDLWRYNPETLSWRKVLPKGKGPRWTTRMCCCVVGQRVVLFGEDAPDELYVLDLSPSLKTLCKLAVLQNGLEQSELPHDIRWELATMTADSNRKEQTQQQQAH